jgi:hypothetical protein
VRVANLQDADPVPSRAPAIIRRMVVNPLNLLWFYDVLTF